MSRPRRSFNRDFKLGAVKLVTEQGYSISQASQRLGVHHRSLSLWVEKLAPGFDPGAAITEDCQDPKALQAELRRLQKENQRLAMERDILKKATAYFAKEQL